VPVTAYLYAKITSEHRVGGNGMLTQSQGRKTNARFVICLFAEFFDKTGTNHN